MNAVLVSLATILVAYLLGSIPSGLLIARWFGKVDIRTVGSGNIGATNVGRVLGFRFFVVVFLLDFLKGYLPTAYFPALAESASGRKLVDLPVLVAVAAILGHNFPAYLGFKGGKGVATSLGSVFALDTVASVGSAAAFTSILLLTGYVSMSSILGGVAWLLFHFARIEHPWGRDQIAMTLASIGLMGLLIVRHRKNLARIAEGTEPKIQLRKKKPPRAPEGRVAVALLAAMAALAGGVAFALNARKTYTVEAGPHHVSEVARVATGHQRAERLTFADRGRLLAATCPRYGRVMLYRVTESDGLDLVRDIELKGRPVALHATSDRIHALVRPNNDARHVEEGWWETFDLEGKPVGDRVLVGLYPDDLAISPDEKYAYVLASGRGEGGDHRPMPALTTFDLKASGRPKVVGRLDFEVKGDDPSRLALSDDGSKAAVSLQGSNSIAWIDMAEPGRPRLLARQTWPESSSPDSLRFDRLGGLLAVDEAGDSLRHQAGPEAEPSSLPIEGGIGDVIEVPGEPAFRAISQPFNTGIALIPASPGPNASPAYLPLKGRANLASTRPLGLAYSPDRKLLAVANRSGGSVHLVALRSRAAER